MSFHHRVPVLRSAGEARQDQKWRVQIMSQTFGRVHRYYAARTSHGVVRACSRLQLQGVRLLAFRPPLTPTGKARFQHPEVETRLGDLPLVAQGAGFTDRGTEIWNRENSN